jgi:hypothetical protein
MNNKTHSLLLSICLIVSSGCLAAGYILAGYWLILFVFPLIISMWVFTNKQSPFWSASSILLVFVTLAAIGIVAELSLMFMIISCTAALVSWDLLQLKNSIAGNSDDNKSLILEKRHLKSLTLAASGGLILTLISANLSLHIPFVVIIFLVLATIVSLIYSMPFAAKKKQ